jgi:hypothetical protein
VSTGCSKIFGIYLSLILAGTLPRAWGQETPAATGNDAASSSSRPSSVRNAERPISWKLLIPNIVHDQKPLWLFPAKVFKGQELKPVVGLTLATAGLVALDPHDTPYFLRTDSFHGFDNAFKGTNTALAMAIVPLSFYGVGLARHDLYAQRTSLLTGEAVADAEILTLVMKNIDRRLRPSDIHPHGDFAHTWFKSHGIGAGSFPSGHAIAAFSIATVLANRYHQHRWVPWVAYGLAGLVGFSRVPLQAHFPSDVFAGAALGYAISHYAVLRQQ